ncbi:MAG: universal stress protein [Candidatus Bathyarchaeia archaeon]|jgi:nucleotide-binding universal stress UspA family protein|nr:universal stress protein [Candidatus Bathyarchaeota archaeon A05DMB-4]MDH7594882.1 universal stress protein [Candidatus Bathyarchaeota archaeon]
MKDKMKILVGIDGSDHSLWALMEAVNIAKKISGAITVITVYTQGKEEEAERIRQKTLNYLKKEEVDNSFYAILGANPSRALVDIAKREHFDLIVVGSRGLGSATAFLVGSVSKQVVSKAPCDVLVVKK